MTQLKIWNWTGAFGTLACLCLTWAGWSQETNVAHVLVCCSVVASQPGQPPREYPWGPEVAFGPGNRLAMTLESCREAQAVVIPWTSARAGLANRWGPVVASLKPDEPVKLPPETRVWRWNTNTQPFRIQVLVLDLRDKMAEDFRRLVGAMNESGLPEPVLKAQEQRLKAMVDECQAAQKRQPTTAPSIVSVAGVFRGAFDWRKEAVGAWFGPGRPAVMHFGGNTNAAPGPGGAPPDNKTSRE
ncbi:MAG: hypothetical protein AAB676_16355 [Verrucomicrobiota bacterium]